MVRVRVPTVLTDTHTPLDIGYTMLHLIAISVTLPAGIAVWLAAAPRQQPNDPSPNAQHVDSVTAFTFQVQITATR